jgi:hypothetical protein
MRRFQCDCGFHKSAEVLAMFCIINSSIFYNTNRTAIDADSACLSANKSHLRQHEGVMQISTKIRSRRQAVAAAENSRIKSR